MIADHSHMRTQSSWLVVIDLACLVFSTVIAILLRFGPEELMFEVTGRLDGWVIFFGSIIVANHLAGSYRVQYTLSRFDLLVTWVFSVAFAVFIIGITSYASCFQLLIGRGVLFLAVVMYGSFSLLLRLVASQYIFGSDLLKRRVVIVGTDPLSHDIRALLENPFIIPHHKVLAWIDINEGPDERHNGAVLHGIPLIGSQQGDLCKVVSALGADLVISPHETGPRHLRLSAQLRRLRFSGVEVLTPRSVMEIYRGKLPLDLIDEESVATLGMETGWPIVWRAKRIMDMTTAFLACVICLPIGIVIALLLKLSSPADPAFYTQERVGQFGKVFKIYKFRTMRVDAEASGEAVWSDRDDPRITPIGSILRKFRLDELPQFWNILKGDMSLVGPRPERPEMVEMLTAEIPFYQERENAVPGLTGWAQIRYPYGSSVEDTRRKLEYDLFYVKNLSLSLDLQIVLRTLRVVLFGREKTH